MSRAGDGVGWGVGERRQRLARMRVRGRGCPQAGEVGRGLDPSLRIQAKAPLSMPTVPSLIHLFL